LATPLSACSLFRKTPAAPEAPTSDAYLEIGPIDDCGAERCGTARVRGQMRLPLPDGDADLEVAGEVVFRERDGRVVTMRAKCPARFEIPATDGSGDTVEATGMLTLELTREYR
jgi:hypothetical protein